MATNNTDYDTTTTHGDTEPATKHDVTEGGVIGAVGGAVVGALAGGPIGAVIGAVLGGAASAGAVDVVDKHDHDYARTTHADTDKAGVVGGSDYSNTSTTGYAADTAAVAPVVAGDRTYADNTVMSDYTPGAPAGIVTDSTYDDTAKTSTYATGANVDDKIVVPIVEEELQVGKRQVQGGGARVHTEIIETPVEETVNLHSEKVVIDRHPVDRAVTSADNAFQGGVVELEEIEEVPVVAKNARVVEEVVIGKTATDRTETIHDTVRRTDVDVEQLDGKTVDARRDI